MTLLHCAKSAYDFFFAFQAFFGIKQNCALINLLFQSIQTPQDFAALDANFAAKNATFAVPNPKICGIFVIGRKCAIIKIPLSLWYVTSGHSAKSKSVTSSTMLQCRRLL